MNQTFEEFPLQSKPEAAIVMHREAHFGGSFQVMLKYYEEGGKGTCSAFSLDEIRKLAEFERASGKNIAPAILTGSDAEIVAQAKKAYQEMRALFENATDKTSYPQLIASLILAEDEDPQNEIDAIVKEKHAIVPFLIEVLKSEKLYDPLFPGYGQAPVLAAKCLGLIGDPRAIIPLFEGIGQEDFFFEDSLLKAIKGIGASAKEFLLRLVKSQPVNNDNTRAAIALGVFKEDLEVSEACFELLEKQANTSDDPLLAHYLAYACENLQNPEKREKMAELMHKKNLSKELALDIKIILDKWRSSK